MTSKLAPIVWKLIRDNPGIAPVEIARALDRPRQAITNALPTLEHNGYLVWEDESARLYPFKEVAK